MSEMEHHHGMLEIPDDQPVPTVSLMLYPDPVQGWNLQLETTNFEFAPERVNESSLPNEGHAHLYINGEKVTRLYSEWYHLPSLPPGEHEIVVGLNANGHEALMHDDSPIEASVMVEVSDAAAATPNEADDANPAGMTTDRATEAIGLP
ncbi:MAG: hypothetical protein F6J97_16420 [Leptolyngbya sp. SIO4C1]|nr:hypothetical protein [Leptolyngbya sp. SIO4C1]